MNLNLLTCTKAQAEKLMDLGITVDSFFEFKEYVQDEAYKVVLVNPLINSSGTPAWTKEEIDTMLGPGFIKPDFLEKKHNSKASDPLSYPIYYPQKQLTFKYGAQASAEVLRYLIEKGEIKAADACERYRQLF